MIITKNINIQKQVKIDINWQDIKSILDKAPAWGLLELTEVYTELMDNFLCFDAVKELKPFQRKLIKDMLERICKEINYDI